jgi:hypothetical protein
MVYFIFSDYNMAAAVLVKRASSSLSARAALPPQADTLF